jgi:leucyl aminopeptidase
MKLKIVTASKLDTIITFASNEQADIIKDFSGDKGETAVRYEDKATLIYCGLGKEIAITADTLRFAAATAVQKAIGLKREKIAMLEPVLESDIPTSAQALIEGALLGVYSFSRFKSEKPFVPERCEFVSESITQRSADAIAVLCESVAFSRDLVNDNAEAVTPARLAHEACTIALDGKIECTVLGEKEIDKQGLGLLKAVGQGAPYPPRLIVLEYTGSPRSKQTTCVVGKGITFDSGGQNLKPTGSIETMRCDMAGAAAVLGLFKALTRLKPKVNVLGVVPAAYNAVDGLAYFPGDIYRSLSGKTVEITSTDAEGRLILADAITYVQKHYHPTEIIDLATLTGAILTALGGTIAGLFSNNDELAKNLFDAGERSGESLWRLPIREEHSESIKGDLADLRNTSKLKKGYAGSITGAAFIKEFVGDMPWAHLDIAGTAFNEADARGEVPKFGTGFGVRLLWEYLERKQAG